MLLQVVAEDAYKMAIEATVSIDFDNRFVIAQSEDPFGGIITSKISFDCILDLANKINKIESGE